MHKFLLIFIFFIFGFLDVSACKFTGKIDECNDAVKPFLTKENGFLYPGDSIRSIEDFICLQDVPENRVFQIALDENFKKIDDEMDIYFDSLTNSKNLYFGKDAEFSYFDGINHIWEKSRYFSGLYSNACVDSVFESAECIENDSYLLPEDKSAISNMSAMDYLKGSNGECENLAKVKIEIFNNVAFNILQLNKAQVSKDQKKLYDQEQRTKYNKVTDLFMINLSYIERIWMKWPSKIKNAL